MINSPLQIIINSVFQISSHIAEFVIFSKNIVKTIIKFITNDSSWSYNWTFTIHISGEKKTGWAEGVLALQNLHWGTKPPIPLRGHRARKHVCASLHVFQQMVFSPPIVTLLSPTLHIFLEYNYNSSAQLYNKDPAYLLLFPVWFFLLIYCIKMMSWKHYY